MLVLFHHFGFNVTPFAFHTRHDGVVARAFASQSINLRLISIVESYQKNNIYSLRAWRLVQNELFGEKAGKLACCAFGQDT